MSRVAQDFLNRCFAPDETIALLLRRDVPAPTFQRIVQVKRALEPRYQGWLFAQNRTGANVHVSANPLEPGSQNRTKKNVASFRFLYIDIDSGGDAKLATLLASDLVPKPFAIISTSPGRYQALWRVRGFDRESQEYTLKLLALAFGGDPACTDCNRVLRIPGFLNQKYNPAHLVAVDYRDDSVWSPSHFLLDERVLSAMRSSIPAARHTPPSNKSASEGDWAWVCDRLAHGKSASDLTRALAARRFDKPNPLYYAQRTVDMASARRWLLKGVRIEKVVALIASRRRFEIPAILCSARAREIAATAERMIAR